MKKKSTITLRLCNAFYSGTQQEFILFQSNCDISCTLIKESFLSFSLSSGDSGFEPSQINYAMHLKSRKKAWHNY